ncbi:MAG: hypothetical protein DMF20_08770 [Verrucomicrobia bacterium]|nr:MAG: hypothetical protein DMF20_08770 [Verrucomicrobiota bacterium]
MKVNALTVGRDRRSRRSIHNGRGFPSKHALAKAWYEVRPHPRASSVIGTRSSAPGGRRTTNLKGSA